MIRINAGFGRKIRRARSLTIETINVTGIALNRLWDDPDDPDHKAMREDIRRCAPPGEGWVLEGYCLVTKKRKGAR